jgi:divalent metal cation (Fe/Co/Zn/Cd) transporter
MISHMDARYRKEWVALLSVVSNTMLVVMKFIVGIGIGSVSVISEAMGRCPSKPPIRSTRTWYGGSND